MATGIKKSQMKDAVGSSWATLARTLKGEALRLYWSNRELEEEKSGDIEQRGQCEDRLTIQPDKRMS